MINVRLYHTIKSHLADPATRVVMSDCAPIKSDVVFALSNWAGARCRELVHSAGSAEFWHDSAMSSGKRNFFTLSLLWVLISLQIERLFQQKRSVYRFKIIHCCLQSTDHRVQISDYRLQSTDLILQITDYRLYITVIDCVFRSLLLLRLLLLLLLLLLVSLLSTVSIFILLSFDLLSLLLRLTSDIISIQVRFKDVQE